ncbi:MAG: phosphatase PAP2 family protein [Salibacteraceae bacterium]
MIRSAIVKMKYFLSLMMAWLISGGILIYATSKDALHLWFNSHHHPFADLFFKYVTHLGDGVFGAFIVLLGFIYKLKYGVIGLIGLAGSSLITQVLKRQVFNHEHRPSKYFEEMAQLHLVDGVQLHSNFSFPSGHATAAFSIFFLLAIIAKKPALQSLFFILVVLVAFSRVYISQHFFEDIYMGSIIGTSVCFLAFAFLKEKSWGEQGATEWLVSKIKR